MSQSSHEKLINFWEKTESNITLAPASEASVVALESKYSIKLPSDFRTFLRKSCPKEDQMDDNQIEFWSPTRIQNIPDEYGNPESIENQDIKKNAEHFLFFSDHGIWCWAWAICCKPGKNYGRIVQFDRDARFVVDSFSQFIDEYVKGTVWFD